MCRFQDSPDSPDVRDSGVSRRFLTTSSSRAASPPRRASSSSSPSSPSRVWFLSWFSATLRLAASFMYAATAKCSGVLSRRSAAPSAPQSARAAAARRDRTFSTSVSARAGWGPRPRHQRADQLAVHARGGGVHGAVAQPAAHHAGRWPSSRPRRASSFAQQRRARRFGLRRGHQGAPGPARRRRRGAGVAEPLDHALVARGAAATRACRRCPRRPVGVRAVFSRSSTAATSPRAHASVSGSSVCAERPGPARAPRAGFGRRAAWRTPRPTPRRGDERLIRPGARPVAPPALQQRAPPRGAPRSPRRSRACPAGSVDRDRRFSRAAGRPPRRVRLARRPPAACRKPHPPRSRRRLRVIGVGRSGQNARQGGGSSANRRVRRAIWVDRGRGGARRPRRGATGLQKKGPPSGFRRGRGN